MRNKFVYSCSIKICALEFEELLKSIFFLLLVVEAFSLQKVVKMPEEVVVGWREVKWIWQMRPNLFNFWNTCCGTYGRALSWRRIGSFLLNNELQVLQLSVHVIDLLSILLRWNGFSGIQKAVVYLTDSRTSNSDHNIFWCKFGFGKWFGTSQSSHWAGHCWLSYKVHFLSNITIQLGNCSLLLHIIREDYSTKWRFFFLNFQSAHEPPHLSNFFTFPICFMLNDHFYSPN